MGATRLNTNAMQNSAVSPVNDTTNMSVSAGGTRVVAYIVIAYDAANDESVTAVSWGGVAATRVGTVAQSGTPQWAYVEVWRVQNPLTGVQTLSITVAGTVQDVYYNLIAYQNVNSASPERAGTFQTGTGTTATASLTVSSNLNDLTFTAVNSGGPAVSGTNETSDGINTAGGYAAGSDHATAPAASVTHTWTFGGASPGYAMLGFSINGDPDGGGASPMFRGSRG